MHSAFRDSALPHSLETGWAHLRRTLFDRWAYVAASLFSLQLFGACSYVCGPLSPGAQLGAVLAIACIWRAIRSRNGACPHCGKPFWSAAAATAVGARCAHCGIPFGTPVVGARGSRP